MKIVLACSSRYFRSSIANHSSLNLAAIIDIVTQAWVRCVCAAPVDGNGVYAALYIKCYGSLQANKSTLRDSSAVITAAKN